MSSPPPTGSRYADPLARAQAISQGSPQVRALGIEVTRIEGARAWGVVRYRPELAGDAESGALAGGVVTTLLDQIGVLAAMLAMERAKAVATIDLRIDHLRPPAPGRDVQCEAHCYKLDQDVCFVRATAYDDTPDDPIAEAASAFLISSLPNKRAPA